MEPFLYLASASPRRVELLLQLPIRFKQIPNLLESEVLNPTEGSIRNQIKQLCVRKALASASTYDKWILTADTCVVLNDTVFGKPKNSKESTNMLMTLSGKTHHVISACCLYHPTSHQHYTCSDSAQVTFNMLTKNDIDHYIQSCHPFDKAGSYAIQDIPEHFLAHLKGSYDTVMGLPSKQLKKLLKRIYT